MFVEARVVRYTTVKTRSFSIRPMCGQNIGMWRTNRRTDRYPLDITAVCTAKNADRVKKKI